MGSILVTLIIGMCQGDRHDYKIQDEYTDCHHWYINCSISKDISIESRSKEEMQKVLKECKDVAQK